MDMMTTMEYPDVHNTTMGVTAFTLMYGRILDIILDKILVSLLCTFGVVGNVLNVVVLVRYRGSKILEPQERVAYVGLINLAMADMSFCLVMLPRVFISEHNVSYAAKNFTMFYQLYGTGLITTCSFISTWLIIFLAATRYLAICYPFYSKLLLSTKASYASLVVIWLGCTLANIPSFMMYQVTHMDNNSGYYLDLGPFAHTKMSGRAFQWVRAVLALFVPAILLLVFNCRLILGLRESFRLRASCVLYSPPDSGVADARKNRLTITLIAVIVTFIILVFPSEFMDIMTHLTRWVRPDNETFILWRRIANTLQVCNFALNFVLYCALHQQFRMSLRDILCPWRRNHANRGNARNRSTRSNDKDSALSSNLLQSRKSEVSKV